MTESSHWGHPYVQHVSKNGPEDGNWTNEPGRNVAGRSWPGNCFMDAASLEKQRDRRCQFPGDSQWRANHELEHSISEETGQGFLPSGDRGYKAAMCFWLCGPECRMTTTEITNKMSNYQKYHQESIQSYVKHDETKRGEVEMRYKEEILISEVVSCWHCYPG